MLAIWVKVRVKPELRQRFLEAIEADALASERDEAGCLRFNVLQDGRDENVYYFYEVYDNQPRWTPIGPSRTTPAGPPAPARPTGPPGRPAGQPASRPAA